MCCQEAKDIWQRFLRDTCRQGPVYGAVCARRTEHGSDSRA